MDTNYPASTIWEKETVIPFAGHPGQMSLSFLILLGRAFSRVYDVTSHGLALKFFLSICFFSVHASSK